MGKPGFELKFALAFKTQTSAHGGTFPFLTFTLHQEDLPQIKNVAEYLQEIQRVFEA